MNGRIARIVTLSLAIALVAFALPGDVVQPLADDDADGLAPTAEAHVCVLRTAYSDATECPRDGCEDGRVHFHVPRHGPSCFGAGPIHS